MNMKVTILSGVYFLLVVLSPLSTAEECSSTYTACQRHCDTISNKAQRIACKSECVANKTGCKTVRWGKRTGNAIEDFVGGSDSKESGTKNDQ